MLLGCTRVLQWVYHYIYWVVISNWKVLFGGLYHCEMWLCLMFYFQLKLIRWWVGGSGFALRMLGYTWALQVRMKIGKSHKNRMTWQYQLTASQQWKLPVGVLHWTYCKSNVHHSSLPRKERVVTSQLQLQWIGLVKHRVPLNSLLLITIPIENAMWQMRISAFQAHPNIRLSVIYIYIASYLGYIYVYHLVI